MMDNDTHETECITTNVHDGCLVFSDLFHVRDQFGDGSEHDARSALG
jgi:hypothetical protein